MSLPQSTRASVYWLVGLGVVLLAIAGMAAWNRADSNPEHIFWATVSQSLRTSAVTIEASQAANGTSMHQFAQYSLGAANMSHSLTTLTRAGTTVRNESIGTPTADYTRYESIKTDQKGTDGKPLNVSKILGVWAKNQTQGPTGTNTGSQLFAQSVLGTSLPLGGVAVPIANLSPEMHAAMLDEMKNDNVYQIDFKKVKKQTKDGHLQYTYNVTVQPILYAGMMKNFAKSLGLHALDQLDPNSFSGQRALQLQLVIDARSKHIISALLPASGAHQSYTSYDVPVSVVVPTQTITVQELQKRLSEIR